MVQHILGQQLHESEEAYKLGMRLIVKLKKLVEKHGQEAGLRLVLEESPAESACYRLASMDLKEYPEAAKEVLRGNVETKDYYYTNSVHYAYDADINYIDRIIGQSKFHPLIDAGAIIHVWLGEQEPEAASIRNLVEKVLLKTECTQLAFSPEFTICEDCKRTYRGLSDKCPSCDSDNVYHVTRIVGYFSKIENWNKAKRAELIDRKRGI
jgi:ribonucleoside-triphosphate reductase